jgi:hypothetical protein
MTFFLKKINYCFPTQEHKEFIVDFTTVDPLCVRGMVCAWVSGWGGGLVWGVQYGVCWLDCLCVV